MGDLGWRLGGISPWMKGIDALAFWSVSNRAFERRDVVLRYKVFLNGG